MVTKAAKWELRALYVGGPAVLVVAVFGLGLGGVPLIVLLGLGGVGLVVMVGAGIGREGIEGRA